MRKFVLLVILVVFFSREAFLQEFNKRIFDERASQEILIDLINRKGLNQEPFNAWFTKGYHEYEPNQNDVEALLGLDPGHLKIIIVLGTWCGDTKREVPRFLKLLDEIAFPEDNLKMIGVNRQKKTNTIDIREFGITNVPTFIFFDKDVEIGRITESPNESLEKDLLKIISK